MKYHLISKIFFAFAILTGGANLSDIPLVNAHDNSFDQGYGHSHGNGYGYGHGRMHCYPIDLRGGATRSLPTPIIEYVVLPEDNNGDGWFETVLKMKVNDPSLRYSPAAVQFFVHYDGAPTKFSVNIGDSKSNNGGSGDAGDQGNDAELMVGSNLENDYDQLWVFGHDGIRSERGGFSIITKAPKFVKEGETIAFTVSNNRVEYKNKDFPVAGDIRSPWLYALRGQADSEGPVNYDIYAAFNRVISGPRYGSGVGKVKVCLIPHAKNHHHKGKYNK